MNFIKLTLVAPDHLNSGQVPVLVNLSHVASIAEHEGKTYVWFGSRSNGDRVVEPLEKIEKALQRISGVDTIDV